MKLNKRVVGIAIIAVVVVGAIIAVVIRAAGPRISVVSPQPRDVVEVVIATGELRVEPESDLGLEIAGTVARVHVREGDHVDAGEVLVELRDNEAAQQVARAQSALETARQEVARLQAGAPPEELEAARTQLEQARVTRELAESEVQRAESLWQDGLLTEAALEQTQSALVEARAREAAARAAFNAVEQLPRDEDLRVMQARVQEAQVGVDAAQERLERTVLEAPFSGLITWRNVDPGEAVTPGVPVLRLADMDGAQVNVETDEANLARIRVGQDATVIPAVFPDQAFPAEVAQIGPQVDAERGVVTIRLQPESLPEDVFVEMTVDASIEIANLPNTLSLPREAVAEDDRGRYVLVVEDGRVHRRDVTVLAEGRQWAAIDGIDSGAVVAQRPIDLQDGDRVRTREEPT